MIPREPAARSRRRRSVVVRLLAVIGIVGLLVVAVRAPAPSADDATRDRVRAFVERAVAYASENGKEAALAAFSQRRGPFHQGELYIYAYDFEGTVLGHGGDPTLVGKNLMETRDREGRWVVRSLTEIARSGSGWYEYLWPNPLHADAWEPKIGYVVRIADDWYLGSGAYTSPPVLPSLRVQLKWYHQAQFAGYYAAQGEGYFAQHGVTVNALPGTPGANPIRSLESGVADVAQASMAQAALLSTDERRYVNIAQVLQATDSELICRVGPGLVTAADLRGRTIATSADREPVVRTVLAALFPGGGDPVFVRALPDIASLTSGQADCLWGSAFNEYFQAVDAGLRIFVVRPEDVGVLNVEDGLYVDERRLDEPAFRDQLTGLLLGLEEGWAFARENQVAAVQYVLQQPGVAVARNGEGEGRIALVRNPAAEARQLDAVLLLVKEPFGYFDVGRYEEPDALGAPVLDEAFSERLWTHAIWDAARAARGTAGIITPVTQHYIELIRSAAWYRILIAIGTFAAAVSGALLALGLGYKLWGMFILAGLTADGGGIIRDILLGGGRYPVWLVRDPLDFALIGAAVALVLAMASFGPARSIVTTDRFATDADVIGFSIIAINGATVALAANAAIVWVPISAALSVAGGGILSDVLANREHASFTGAIYDEVAIVGSLVLLGGLLVANEFEHQPALVLAAVLVALAALLVMRFAVLRLGLRYPEGRIVLRRGQGPGGGTAPGSATAAGAG